MKMRIPRRGARNFSLRILGIESTCDDTGVSIVNANRKIEHNLLASQWSVHQKHGGIVPMLAARAHRENLPHLLHEIGALPNTTDFISSTDNSEKNNDKRTVDPVIGKIDAVAVSAGPGLALCLHAELPPHRQFDCRHCRD